MKKIIHLSDLHVGFGDCGDKFDIVISNLVRLKTPCSDYVIVITGDLVETADTLLYRQVRHKLKNLTNEGFQVLVVPGNHDYGFEGIKGDAGFVPEFKKAFFNNININYPKLDIINDKIDDKSIAFIGLDSLEEELNWYDCLFSDGELGDMQLAKLEKILRQKDVIDCTKRVVYLHHHPFDTDWTMELKDADKLLALLQKSNNPQKTDISRVDALLFGHGHKGRIFNGAYDIPLVLESGTSTGKGGDSRVIRVIDLDVSPAKIYTMDIF